MALTIICPVPAALTLLFLIALVVPLALPVVIAVGFLYALARLVKALRAARR